MEPFFFLVSCLSLSLRSCTEYSLSGNGLAGVQFYGGRSVQCVSLLPTVAGLGIDKLTDINPTTVDEVALWAGGLTFHHLALLIGAVFALVAGGVSFYLIMGHATHYSKPIEQRQ